MQFQVPQFIETEDTIVGPLTIRQFILLSIAGALTFLLYFLLDTFVWLVFAVLIMGSGFALALIKFNGQSLPRLLKSFFLFHWRSQQYTWQPDAKTQEKNAQALRNIDAGGFSLEKIIYGAALRSAWHDLQTGKKMTAKNQQPIERYQPVIKASGERKMAKRIDFV